MPDFEIVLFHLTVALRVTRAVADRPILAAVRVGRRRVDAFGGRVYTGVAIISADKISTVHAVAMTAIPPVVAAGVIVIHWITSSVRYPINISVGAVVELCIADSPTYEYEKEDQAGRP